MSDYTFHAPGDWTRLEVIDAHTAGEPLRVITGGFPEPPGATILEKRRYAREHLDGLRRALMLEPRGHADMYGCLLTEPVTPDGDVGVLFLHNEGYSTMCGHGIIGLVKVGVEAGRLPVRGARSTYRIDTPAGRVTATAEVGEVDGRPRVGDVSFLNVPSFLAQREVRVEVPGLGAVAGDLGYGGAFYLYVDVQSVGVAVEPARFAELVDVAMRIKRATMEQVSFAHPNGDTDLDFLYGVILHQPGTGGAHSRNVCVFADGEVDRSPTGTGVSGRAAVLHGRGELALHRDLEIESLIGTRFGVRLVEALDHHGVAAVVPQVRGRAHVTGRASFVIDPEDPLRDGFLLR